MNSLRKGKETLSLSNVLVTTDHFFNVEVVYRAYRSDITVWIPVLAISSEIAHKKAIEYVEKTQFVHDGNRIISVTCFPLINAL